MSLDNYSKLEIIGEGTYGVVWKARDKRTGRFVALKRIRLDSGDEGIPSTALREICLLKELDHPNVVRLLDVVHTADKLTLVFEYAPYDLKRYIEAHQQRVPPATMKSFMFQLLRGVAFLHSKRVLHRDLKPPNLLVDASGTLKLADFGLARALGIPVRQFTHEVVTLWYRPPEVLLGFAQYGTPLDMWSVGCIFAEMAAGGKPLFPGRGERDQLMRVFRAFGTPDETVWPGVMSLPQWRSDFPKYKLGGSVKGLVPSMDDELVDLVNQMFRYDPAKRVSARTAMTHRYFRDVADKGSMPTDKTVVAAGIGPGGVQ